MYAIENTTNNKIECIKYSHKIERKIAEKVELCRQVDMMVIVSFYVFLGSEMHDELRKTIEICSCWGISYSNKKFCIISLLSVFFLLLCLFLT